MSPKAKAVEGAAPKLTKIEMNPAPTYGLAAAPSCSKLITIRITQKGFVNHRQPVMSGECVRWKDQTGQARCLHFTKWPFTEPWQPICVPANGYSNTYHVAPVPKDSYPYQPDPKISVGPPNPPDLVVGG